MIVVIADDYTGAAEIGGIGLRYQMKVKIVTEVGTDCDADLLIIATNIRSKTKEDGVAEIRHILRQLTRLKIYPTLIYKKIDSVLRGHIIAELTAQMKMLGKRIGLIVPANPHIGRIIKDNIYYIQDKKLHETGFRNDPEFAAISSHVRDLLRNKDNGLLSIVKHDETLPEEGLVISEASTVNDLRLWADRINNDMAIAGAAGFFSALLDKKGYSCISGSSVQSRAVLGKKKLFVFGSPCPYSRRVIGKAKKAGESISFMPDELATATGDQLSFYCEQWALEIISLFEKHNRVIISTDPSVLYKRKEQSDILSNNMGRTVRMVMKNVKLQELLLEGGSTAFAVLKELELNRFYPKQELAYGVIRMSIPEDHILHITLKPGSYEWPACLLPSNTA